MPTRRLSPRVASPPLAMQVMYCSCSSSGRSPRSLVRLWRYPRSRHRLNSPPSPSTEARLTVNPPASQKTFRLRSTHTARHRIKAGSVHLVLLLGCRRILVSYVQSTSSLHQCSRQQIQQVVHDNTSRQCPVFCLAVPDVAPCDRSQPSLVLDLWPRTFPFSSQGF